MTVPVYVFSSNSMTNIWAGYGARRWAVADVKQETVTKAAGMKIGSQGILYCSHEGRQGFTMPFVTVSEPDPSSTEKYIWSGEWVLPFSIRPLGSPDAFVPKGDLAMGLSGIPKGKNWSHYLHVQGLTKFVPSSLSQSDWEWFLRKLT